MANFCLLVKLCFSIGFGIGIFHCNMFFDTSEFHLCNQWDTEALDSLANVISIHEIIAAICVFGCVQRKILNPLMNYLSIMCPVYEGKLLKIICK